MIAEQFPRGVGVDHRPELEHHAEVVGQFLVREVGAGVAIDLLEAHQLDAALAGVAARVVGQIERASAGDVEGVDVLALQPCQLVGFQPIEVCREPGPGVRRRVGEGAP